MADTPVADALSERVHDLLHDILAESGGGFVEGFIVMASYTDETGAPRWCFSVAPEQRMVTTTGLIEMADTLNGIDMVQALTGEDD